MDVAGRKETLLHLGPFQRLVLKAILRWRL